jgi:hypothetical protein
MKKIFLATLVALAGAVALEGCVTVNTFNARKLVANAPPDNHVSVILEPATGGQSNLAKTLGDQHLATLFPSMLVRLPLVFKHNGLDTVATLNGFAGAVATPVLQEGRQLHLRPSEAYAYGRAYASLLVLEARLEDPKLGTLWTGEVRLSNGSGNPEYGNAAADRAALTLLTQLRDAQLIDISWRPPTAP